MTCKDQHITVVVENAPECSPRHVVVKVPKSPNAVPTRAFVYIERSGRESDYNTVVEVLSHAELQAEMLARALKEAKDWQQRYRDLDALAGVFEAIGKASKNCRKRGKKKRS